MNPRYKLILFVLILIIFGIVFLTYKYKGNSIKDDSQNKEKLPEATSTTNIASVCSIIIVPPLGRFTFDL